MCNYPFKFIGYRPIVWGICLRPEFQVNPCSFWCLYYRPPSSWSEGDREAGSLPPLLLIIAFNHSFIIIGNLAHLLQHTKWEGPVYIEEGPPRNSTDSPITWIEYMQTHVMFLIAAFILFVSLVLSGYEIWDHVYTQRVHSERGGYTYACWWNHHPDRITV